MHRRHFLAASLASSAVALAKANASITPPEASTPDQAAASPAREFYLLRRYQLQNGPQTRLCETYFADALLPALARLKLGPVGAFRLEMGPETPAFYLLIPGPSPAPLATLDLNLADDPVFLKAAEPFWAAPATTPAYLRVDSSLLAAFTGWPRLTPPAPPAGKTTRVFQLRTYESPSDRDHIRKVQMFNDGEFAIFVTAGAQPVFFGDTLVGPRLPSLTYMLSFPDMAALDAHWKKFPADPAWKKLSTSPQYSYEQIVSSITNLILAPLACSQL